MEEISVNDYIRTKDGEIDKVDALYGMIENTVHLEKQKWFDTRNILKHSPNIIDLIEVGDYVNGSKVHHIREDVDDYGNDFKEINIENCCMLNYYIREEDIKSIVTKEMMKNVMYEV